jgi:hypothetical protein
VTDIVWCSECGQHMRKSFTALALICPTPACGTVIPYREIENLEGILEWPRPFVDWLERAFERSLQRTIEGSVDDMLFGSMTGRPMGIVASYRLGLEILGMKGV